MIPITALAEVIRSDCKNECKNLHRFNYYLIVTIAVMTWIVTIPTWIPFFQYAQNLENAYEIFAIVLKLIPFYVAYAGCTVIDNIFVGLGKTFYTLINSLIINFGYYGIFYILYKAKVIAFDINTIVMMFGFGMVAHFAISLIEERLFFRKKECIRQC